MFQMQLQGEARHYSFDVPLTMHHTFHVVIRELLAKKHGVVQCIAVLV
jgi:hypothetical protein